jgi:hypothetical protein
MTVPYLAKAYEVPEDYLFAQLGLPQEGNRHKSLAQLNREYAPGERGIMLERVKEALRRYQAEHHTLPPEPRHD